MMGSHCEKAVGEDGNKVNVGIQETSRLTELEIHANVASPTRLPELIYLLH